MQTTPSLILKKTHVSPKPLASLVTIEQHAWVAQGTEAVHVIQTSILLSSYCLSPPSPPPKMKMLEKGTQTIFHTQKQCVCACVCIVHTHTDAQHRKWKETHMANSRQQINSLAAVQNTHVRAHKYMERLHQKIQQKKEREKKKS